MRDFSRIQVSSCRFGQFSHLYVSSSKAKTSCCKSAHHEKARGFRIVLADLLGGNDSHQHATTSVLASASVQIQLAWLYHALSTELYYSGFYDSSALCDTLIARIGYSLGEHTAFRNQQWIASRKLVQQSHDVLLELLIERRNRRAYLPDFKA